MSDYFSNQDLSGLLSFEGEDCLDLFGNGASGQLNQWTWREAAQAREPLMHPARDWPGSSVYPWDPNDAVGYSMPMRVDSDGIAWNEHCLQLHSAGPMTNDGHFLGSTTDYYHGIPGQEPESGLFGQASGAAFHQTVLDAGVNTSDYIQNGTSAIPGTGHTELPHMTLGHHHMLSENNQGPPSSEHHGHSVRRERTICPKAIAVEDLLSVVSDLDTFTFESGCKVTVKSTSVSKAPKQSRKVTSYKTGLFFTFAGCQEKREFRRKYELERHMRKHNPREAYSCPVLECGRHGRQPFYREDKLKAHMETMHCGDEPSACPKAYCQAGVLPFDLLRVHVQSHIIPEGNVFANFLSRSCPVAGCKVKPRLEVRNIPGPRGHLMRYHGPAERAKQHAIITEAGFDSSSGEIICPICRQKSQNQDSFARHLENTHLGQHAAAFERVVRPSISEAAHNASDEFERQSLLNWRVWHDIPDAVSGQCFQCPGCMYCFGTVDDELPWTKVSDHVGLFVPTEELRRHRREILRLLPSFNSHPVFDDVRRTT